MKKLLLMIVFTMVVSCSSIRALWEAATTQPVKEQTDNSPKGTKDAVKQSIFIVAHIGAVGGFIIAILAGVGSVTVPSKRLASVSFFSALVGSICLLYAYLEPFINYIVYGALVAVSAWGLYQLYKRHHEGLAHKKTKGHLIGISKEFENVNGRSNLSIEDRTQLILNEGEENE